MKPGKCFPMSAARCHHLTPHLSCLEGLFAGQQGASRTGAPEEAWRILWLHWTVLPLQNRWALQGHVQTGRGRCVSSAEAGQRPGVFHLFSQISPKLSLSLWWLCCLMSSGQIHIDIPRTNPLIPLFQQPAVQEVRQIVTRLFLW